LHRHLDLHAGFEAGAHEPFPEIQWVRSGSSDRGLSVGVRHGRWLGQQLFAFGVQSADDFTVVA
jgi:hypothetical protein